jgi:hypothetical protein
MGLGSRAETGRGAMGEARRGGGGVSCGQHPAARRRCKPAPAATQAPAPRAAPATERTSISPPLGGSVLGSALARTRRVRRWGAGGRAGGVCVSGAAGRRSTRVQRAERSARAPPPLACGRRGAPPAARRAGPLQPPRLTVLRAIRGRPLKVAAAGRTAWVGRGQRGQATTSSIPPPRSPPPRPPAVRTWPRHAIRCPWSSMAPVVEQGAGWVSAGCGWCGCGEGRSVVMIGSRPDRAGGWGAGQAGAGQGQRRGGCGVCGPGLRGSGPLRGDPPSLSSGPGPRGAGVGVGRGGGGGRGAGGGGRGAGGGGRGRGAGGGGPGRSMRVAAGPTSAGALTPPPGRTPALREGSGAAAFTMAAGAWLCARRGRGRAPLGPPPCGGGSTRARVQLATWVSGRGDNGSKTTHGNAGRPAGTRLKAGALRSGWRKERAGWGRCRVWGRAARERCGARRAPARGSTAASHGASPAPSLRASPGGSLLPHDAPEVVERRRAAHLQVQQRRLDELQLGEIGVWGGVGWGGVGWGGVGWGGVGGWVGGGGGGRGARCGVG